MFTIEDVEVSITLMAEHESIRGNYIVSGDDDYDKKCEDEIIASLEEGNFWAWCSLKIKVVPKELKDTGRLTGFSYLGCCSYQNEEEFEQSDSYKDMIDWALDDLNKKSLKIYEYLKDKFTEMI